MAVFDVAHRRMCVRIVYDGPAASGKTTNARQLASAFASQRWGELDTPEELAGRTLWFDWLQIRAGVVCGFPLICQVVTVPGQVALTPRRRKLLAGADVVVFVCDSTPGALSPARTALALVEDLALGQGASAPRILQANKQDRVGALDPAAVASALGWQGGHVLGAVATEGMGVVDTFVSAVRALSRSLEERMARDGLRLTATRVEGAGAVLARLAATAIDPEDAAEMLLEEVAASLVVAEPPPRIERGATESSSTPPLDARAQLPTASVPTGFVWPAHTGRATLHALEEAGALRGDASIDAAGEARVEVEGHLLETSLDDRFDDVDDARQALVHAARERTQLEGLLVGGTVLAVQEARGGHWLWRVAPRLTSFEERMSSLPVGARERLELVDAAAAAVAAGAALTMRRRIALRPALDAFGLQGDEVRYGGRLCPCDAPDRAAGELIARIGDALEALGAPRDRFLDVASRELSRRLGSDDAARSVTSALEVRAA